MSLHPKDRIKRLCVETIKKFDINLSGLSIFTEAATGHYGYIAHLCALAGAHQVIALAKNTRWGTANAAIEQGLKLAQKWKVETRVHFTTDKRQEDLSQIDILTNSGNVRPINESLINLLKPSCVIPLMWETWEHRPDELDLSACKKRDILVLGTDEEKIGFRRYLGMIILKELLNEGLEVQNNHILVLASHPTTQAICSMLKVNGASFRWSCPQNNPRDIFPDHYIPPDQHHQLLDWASRCDAVICDDRHHHAPLIGNPGILSTKDLVNANPNIKILYRSGEINLKHLTKAGLYLFPNKTATKEYPNLTSAALGPLPVIELTAASIKVAQVMARARLSGMSPSEAAKMTIKTTPAQDFSYPNAWIKQTSRI